MEDEAIDAILDCLKKQDFASGLVLLNNYMEKKPDNIKLLNLRANVYSTLRQHDKAVNDLKNAIRIAPSLLELHYNLGNEYSRLGNHYAAIRSFKKALEIDPTNLSALFNIGNALMKNGQYGEAATKYKDVLEIEPDHAACTANLLRCYASAKAYEEFSDKSMKILGTSKCSLEISKTIMSLSLDLENNDIFQKTLNHITENWGLDFDAKILVARHKARFANLADALRFLDGESWTVDEAHKVYYAVSGLYLANHQHTKAFIFLEKALNLSPKNPDYLKGYAALLENRVVPHDTVDRTSLLSSILDLNLIRPESIAGELSSATYKLLKELMPLEGQILGWDRICEIIRTIFESGLFTRVLQKGQFVTSDMEGLLSNLSMQFVEHRIEVYRDTNALLLWQYFIIYNHRNGFLIQSDLAPNQAPSKVPSDLGNLDNMADQDIASLHCEILVAATYSMLTEDMSEILMDSDNKDLEPIQGFIRETKKINRYRKVVEESVRTYSEPSAIVTGQSHNYPYPSWQTLISKEKGSIPDYLDGFPIIYERNAIINAEMPNVLIAGCGTGRQALEFGSAVPTADVDAIDISSQCLAFAQIRQEDTQINNVRFSLGDIYTLDKNSNTYNLIDSIGVLHHSSEPEKALSHLASLLKPGGVMLVGFYSSHARQEIIGIRDKFGDMERLKTSTAVLRAERTKLFTSEGFTKSWMNFSPDFYSITGFKELFLNVQEHTYTLAQVSSLLTKNSLKFCGLTSSVYQLALDADEISRHRPDDINYWAAYEERNSSTFGRMYKFWCQKTELA